MPVVVNVEDPSNIYQVSFLRVKKVNTIDGFMTHGRRLTITPDQKELEITLDGSTA